jgi:hypothetical protein|tara:strand:+ start:624 stop:830 length:207 start_codon:yes stop_codon:yes gene_type:complete
MMENIIDPLIFEFKKIKRIRGDLFKNFLSFVHLYLTGTKDDKYKEIKLKLLNYIVANEKTIKMKLVQN